MRLPNHNHQNRIISGKPFGVIACENQNRVNNVTQTVSERTWDAQLERKNEYVYTFFLHIHHTATHISSYRKLFGCTTKHSVSDNNMRF